jgi:hypothetical protein
MLCCVCIVVVLTGALCREEVVTPGRGKQKNTKFQKFKTCKNEMVFVAYFMKLVYLDTVNPDNPVLKLPKTKTLYDHIVGQYKVYVEENKPANAYNHPGNLKDLYSHTWDYRWQYAVMSAINDFIRSGDSGIQQRSIQEEWIAYLEEVSEVYEYTDKHPPTSAAAVAPTNMGAPPAYKGPNAPAKAGDTSTNAGGRSSTAAKTGAGNTTPATKPVVQPSAAAKTGADNTIPATKPVVQPPAGANEGQTSTANADIPKLALPSVSPPVSEVSEDDVKSDGEESDADGAGQDIGTVPSTPADTNFEPESTPPPDQKAGGGRPQSAPQQRTVKETKSAEDLVSGRHRGFETARDKKRSEVYKKNRIQKPDGKDGPPAGSGQQTPTSTPGTPRSGAAGGGAGAGGRFRENTLRPKPYDKPTEKDASDEKDDKMRLGSELHTFPADASLDFIDNLTRRLQDLQEW